MSNNLNPFDLLIERGRALTEAEIKATAQLAKANKAAEIAKNIKEWQPFVELLEEIVPDGLNWSVGGMTKAVCTSGNHNNPRRYNYLRLYINNEDDEWAIPPIFVQPYDYTGGGNRYVFTDPPKSFAFHLPEFFVENDEEWYEFYGKQLNIRPSSTWFQNLEQAAYGVFKMSEAYEQALSEVDRKGLKFLCDQPDDEPETEPQPPAWKMSVHDYNYGPVIADALVYIAKILDKTFSEDKRGNRSVNVNAYVDRP